MAYLSVENLEKAFGGTRVLRDVSFQLPEGETLSVIGSSGSGKTTLLRCLNFLERPDGGVISLRGEPLLDASRPPDRERDLRRKRLHFGLVFQDFNLFPLLTAEENVCYPLRLRKEDKDQALALARQRLADMGIRESYFRKLPNQLSGGEQQRVAIARALAAGSYVILADEPTGNLDSGNSRMIVETLQRLAHQEKRCVIVVTHDPAVANAADVQLRMQDGRLTQEEQQAEA